MCLCTHEKDLKQITHAHDEYKKLYHSEINKFAHLQLTTTFIIVLMCIGLLQSWRLCRALLISSDVISELPFFIISITICVFLLWPFVKV